MSALVEVSEEIVYSIAKFKKTIRKCDPEHVDKEKRDHRWVFGPDKNTKCHDGLDKLWDTLSIASCDLKNLIIRSDTVMLAAINKLFHSIIYDKAFSKALRKKGAHEFNYNMLLKNGFEFMTEFVNENSPKKKREALLEKLKTDEFKLPKLLFLYKTYKRFEEGDSTADMQQLSNDNTDAGESNEKGAEEKGASNGADDVVESAEETEGKEHISKLPDPPTPHTLSKAELVTLVKGAADEILHK